MKTWTILSTFLFLPSALAQFSCNDCNSNCGTFSFLCKSKKELCEASGAPFRQWLRVVNGACYWARNSAAQTSLINSAKSRLSSMGIFSSWQLNNVDMRFCGSVGVSVNLGFTTINAGADAITLGSGKILFDNSVSNLSVDRFAALMAHEMFHTRQYSQYGYNGFACRYSAELIRGRGFGSSNTLEAPAYTFQSQVLNCLSRDSRSLCP